MNNIKNNKESGNVLLMSILMLNSIFLISLALAQIVFVGIRMSNNEIKSAEAYFAADAGSERVLWEFRKGPCVNDLNACRFDDYVDYDPNKPFNQYYDVVVTGGSNVIFHSHGTYGDQHRKVEVIVDVDDDYSY